MKPLVVALALALAAFAFATPAKPSTPPRPPPRPPRPGPPGPRPTPRPTPRPGPRTTPRTGPDPGTLRVSVVAGDRYLLEFAIEYQWLERMVEEHGGEWTFPNAEQAEIAKAASFVYGFRPEDEQTPETPLFVKAVAVKPMIFSVPAHSHRPEETALFLRAVTRLSGPMPGP